MSGKNILNLALLVFVIILASVIYLSKEETHELEMLTNVNVTDVNNIVISHNNNNTTITRSGDNQWQITQPVAIAANNFRINTILDLLHAPVHNQYPATELDAGTAGLSNPMTTIQFNGLSMAFGIINPVTNLRYVRLNDQVYTIEDVYFPLLTSHYSALVSLNLLPTGSHIEKIALPKQTLYKDDKGSWRSDNDSPAALIKETIDNWHHIQAFAVHRYMERKHLGNISVYLSGSSQPVNFTLSDTDPWLILARQDIDLEYHLEKSEYRKLFAK